MSVKSFTLWFYLQWISGKHTRRERVRESSSTHPKTERELEGKVKKTTQPSLVLDPPTDLVAVVSFRPTHRSRCRRRCLLQTHPPILPPPPLDWTHHDPRWRAIHRDPIMVTQSTSDPPWPSCLCRVILPPPPLDWTQPPLSLSSFFSQFDWIWWIFWFDLILYICLEAEKMWTSSRKCVFNSIFKNTTKH